MTIKVTCPACGKILNAPDSSAGKKGKCSCGNVCVVPATAAAQSNQTTTQEFSPPAMPSRELTPAAVETSSNAEPMAADRDSTIRRCLNIFFAALIGLPALFVLIALAASFDNINLRRITGTEWAMRAAILVSMIALLSEAYRHLAGGIRGTKVRARDGGLAGTLARLRYVAADHVEKPENNAQDQHRS